MWRFTRHWFLTSTLQVAHDLIDFMEQIHNVKSPNGHETLFCGDLHPIRGWNPRCLRHLTTSGKQRLPQRTLRSKLTWITISDYICIHAWIVLQSLGFWRPQETLELLPCDRLRLWLAHKWQSWVSLLRVKVWSNLIDVGPLSCWWAWMLKD